MELVMFIVPAGGVLVLMEIHVNQIGRALNDIGNAGLTLELKDELAGGRGHRNGQQGCRRRSRATARWLNKARRRN